MVTPTVSYSVTLRPGGPDEKKTAQLENLGEVEAWAKENGKPGDRYEWVRQGPGRTGVGTRGSGVVP